SEPSPSESALPCGAPHRFTPPIRIDLDVGVAHEECADVRVASPLRMLEPFSIFVILLQSNGQRQDPQRAQCTSRRSDYRTWRRVHAYGYVLNYRDEENRTQTG